MSLFTGKTETEAGEMSRDGTLGEARVRTRQRRLIWHNTDGLSGWCTYDGEGKRVYEIRVVPHGYAVWVRGRALGTFTDIFQARRAIES